MRKLSFSELSNTKSSRTSIWLLVCPEGPDTFKFYLKCNGKSLKGLKQGGSVINMIKVLKVLALCGDWTEGGLEEAR